MRTNLSIALLLLGMTGSLLRAQSFSIDWQTIDGGGGTSVGGVYALSGTVAQPDAGTMTGGNFKIEGGFWNGLTLVQTPGAPLLRIQLVGANVVISWPLDAAGFQLEETTQLRTVGWNNTLQPVIDTATEHTVTVPTAGVVRYYRLHKLEIP